MKSKQTEWKVFHRYDINWWDSHLTSVYAYVIINHMYHEKLNQFGNLSLTKTNRDEDASTDEYVLFKTDLSK